METIYRFDLIKDYLANKSFFTQQDLVIVLYSFLSCVSSYTVFQLSTSYATLYHNTSNYNLLEYLIHFTYSV